MRGLLAIWYAPLLERRPHLRRNHWRCRVHHPVWESHAKAKSLTFVAVMLASGLYR